MNIQYRAEFSKLLDHFNLPRVVLELGVAESLFTKEILKWNLDKLYLIDSWQKIPGQFGDGSFDQSWHDGNYAQTLERVKPFGEMVSVFKGFSTDMSHNIPDNSLGILYIDACHVYECVKKDLELYFPKVVKGGVIALHDWKNLTYGVNKAVKEFCEGRFEINDVPDEEEAMASCWFRKK